MQISDISVGGESKMETTTTVKLLKSGKGNSNMYSFSHHCSMANKYLKFYIFLPKHFEARQGSVCGPSPGPGYCWPYLTQAVTSQAGHIKVAY